MPAPCFSWVPLALFIVVLVAMLFTAVYGWTSKPIVHRLLRRSPGLAPLISAVGISVFFQN